MSESKHTPGAWTVEKRLVVGPDGVPVALVLATNGDTPRVAANARLIAAAPQLLGALEGLMEWEEEIAADLRQHTSPGPLLDAARSAIRAARGES